MASPVETGGGQVAPSKVIGMIPKINQFENDFHSKLAQRRQTHRRGGREVLVRESLQAITEGAEWSRIPRSQTANWEVII
jgi:hypothetical protein